MPVYGVLGGAEIVPLLFLFLVVSAVSNMGFLWLSKRFKGFIKKVRGTIGISSCEYSLQLMSTIPALSAGFDLRKSLRGAASLRTQNNM